MERDGSGRYAAGDGERRRDDAAQAIAGFRFRGLHPQVRVGTASDRYAGWLGQIYSDERYGRRISGRSKTVGGKVFREQILPVESVEEYFEHFDVLEIDYTFYAPLLDAGLKPTGTYRVLQSYRKHLRPGDLLLLKVPQSIVARRLWSKGRFLENADYLSAEIFTRRFYEPALDLLGPALAGFVFEQAYEPKKERVAPEAHIAGLDSFFSAIPKDARYHLEIRTPSLLTRAYFDLLERLGLGQVLSHWTWLPPLGRQFALGGRVFHNAAREGVLRLMTPRGMRYEEAYAKAHPFDRMIPGLMSPGMITDTAELMAGAVEAGVRMHVVINNRAGGNAPAMAQQVAEAFLEKTEAKPQ